MRFHIVYSVLAVVAVAGIFFGGYQAGPRITTVKRIERPAIRNGAPLPVVLGNFTGKPAGQGISLSEIPGYTCQGYAEQASPTVRGYGSWVIAVCER